MEERWRKRFFEQVKEKDKEERGRESKEKDKEERERERKKTLSSPYCMSAASNVSLKNKIKMFSCRFLSPFWRDTGIAKRVPDSSSICLFF